MVTPLSPAVRREIIAFDPADPADPADPDSVFPPELPAAPANLYCIYPHTGNGLAPFTGYGTPL